MPDEVPPGREPGPRPSSGPTIAGRPVRFWVIVAVVVVGAVLVLQNSQTTEVQILWFEIRMPLVFVLLAMVAIGVALDRLWLWRQKKK